MRRLHIANAGNRDAIVVAAPPKVSGGVTQGLDGKPAKFRKYIAAAEGDMNDDLVAEIGDDLSQALIDGDPEIDLEHVGRFLEGTQSILTTSAGEPMYASPQMMEITLDPQGVETGRKAPTDVAATVTEEIPLRWTGRKMPRGEVVRQFMFRRSLQLKHVDGVTFDFLYAMAKELHDEDAMMLMGAGENGKEAVILQVNGSAYRGFLEGRIEGESFKLFLHLSNMELKKPAAKAAGGAE